MWLKELKVETFSVKILYIEYKQMVVLLSSLLRSNCKDFLQQHHLSFAFIIDVKMNVYQYMSFFLQPVAGIRKVTHSLFHRFDSKLINIRRTMG